MKFFKLNKLSRYLFLALGGFFFLTASLAEPNISPSKVPPRVEIISSTPPTQLKMVPSITPSITKPTRLWNLQDADILSVINEVSQETGKNFVVDPRVSGKITLISSKPIRRSEVYQVFLSILGMLGYSAIPSGNVIKIVPNMESGETATQISTKQFPGHGDEVVVRVYPLQNVSASQLIPILRPLLPQWSNISAYTPGNVLIVVGRAANLQRIMHIIQEVDSASNTGIQIIPLRHASASQVATVLNNLQNAARASGETTSVSIAVDERSNSILLGGPRAMRLRMRVLIAQMDAPAATSAGNTEVVYLRYLEAKKFAPLLGKIAQNILGKGSSGGSSSEPVNINSAITSAMGGGGPNSGYGVSGNSKSESNEVVINNGIIQAEPSTNALIITAPPTLMHALRAVIAKLDIRPAQVLVEAIIADVDESNLRNLGIQWGGRGFDGTEQPENSPPEGQSITGFPPIGAGVFGIIPGGVKLRVVLNLLENLNGVDILSTPSIVVLDNQKATIEIGQDVPYQIGSYATSNQVSTVQPFNTIQAKPVTLKLDVTPQINLGQSVRLKIKLKNDSLQNPQNPGLNPIINTSKINNAVIINSDDILVIGGLIKNANNENINKVPILGDIPLLGLLFQQKIRTVAKSNLMVFIKPIILHNNDESMVVSHIKYNFIRRKQANFSEDLLSVGRQPAKTFLPPWKNTKDLPTPFERWPQ